jgi:hypothetical protein
MLKCFLFVNVDGSLSLSFSFQKHGIHLQRLPLPNDLTESKLGENGFFRCFKGLPVSCGVCYKLSLLLLSKTALAVITKSCSYCGYEKAALTVIIKKLLLLRL